MRARYPYFLSYIWSPHCRLPFLQLWARSALALLRLLYVSSILSAPGAATKQEHDRMLKISLIAAADPRAPWE